jgi:hypothetical protein
MAGGGDSNEMNPFISYVDLFASIIMVLLLFILIMFVNVGYYIQFNSKNKTENKDAAAQQEKTQAEAVASALKIEKFKEIEKEKEKIIQSREQIERNNTTPVQGGETEGNIVTKESERYALADFKEQDMVIAFKNNEYFLTKELISQVTTFMQNIVKKNPNAFFYISVNDSKKIISSTQTKQVSLGRILSIKNALQKDPVLQNKIKINFQQAEPLNYDFGYLKIDVK